MITWFYSLTANLVRPSTGIQGASPCLLRDYGRTEKCV